MEKTKYDDGYLYIVILNIGGIITSVDICNKPIDARSEQMFKKSCQQLRSAGKRLKVFRYREDYLIYLDEYYRKLKS